MQVTCVIPTYNGISLLRKYLLTVVKALRDKDEILIVDDNSSDDTVSFLIGEYRLQKADKPPVIPTPKQYYPNPNSAEFDIYYGSTGTKLKKIRVILIHLKRNLRFAGASNLGVLLASHQYIFLVNNDVQVSPDTITTLINNFEDPDVFAVGCLEYEDSFSGEKAGKNKLWFEKGMFRHSKASDFKSGETGWASGGSAMFDKTKWISLSGFDKMYSPAYWEDVDLSYRARKAGFKVLFDENAVVFHKHESTNNSIFGRKEIENMSWKNARYFSWKNSTFSQKLQFLFWTPYWRWKQA